MKKLALILLFCTLFSNAQTTTKNSEPTLLEWQGKAAFNNYAPVGSLAVDKAIVAFNNDTIQTLIVSVDMSSLTQENKQLEGHLRGPDFFDVTVYSKASFTLTRPLIIKDSTVVLEGKMTIRDKTQTERINAFIIKENDTLVIAFDHIFDRTSYGINYNSPSIFKRIKENAIDDAFTLKGVLTFK